MTQAKDETISIRTSSEIKQLLKEAAAKETAAKEAAVKAVKEAKKEKSKR